MNHMCRAFMSSQQLDLTTSAMLRMTLQCMKRNYNTASKEVAVPQLSQGQEVLLNNMRSATNVSELLLSVRMHYGIMNNTHLAQAFRSLFALQKSNKSLLTNNEVVKSTAFRVLCMSLKTQIRTLNAGEVLDALKALSYLGVPTNSKLAQILLHALTKELNSLSLHKLMFLDMFLKDFAASPVVEALRTAIPFVVEGNLSQVDRGNISQLCDLLYYATRKGFSQISCDFLIDAISGHPNLGSIDTKSYTTIARSLSSLDYIQESHGPLLHRAIDGLIGSPGNQSYSELRGLVVRLSAKFTTKAHYLYHKNLLNTITDSIIAQSSSFEETIQHLHRLVKFGHVSIDLLDFIWEMILSEPGLLTKSQPLLLFTLVGGFAQADYLPPGWKVLEPLIVSNVFFHMGRTKLLWLKFARDLGTLNCWPKEILYTLFSKQYLSHFLSKELDLLNRRQLLCLHSGFASLCDWFEEPLVPKDIFDDAVRALTEAGREYQLEKYLSCVFDNKCKIFTGIVTRRGHFIEYLVVTGEDEPTTTAADLKASSSGLFLEDIHRRNLSQKLAFFFLPRSAYVTNTGRYSGPTRMMFEAIESTGVTVVPLNLVVWGKLFVHEKLRYIEQEVGKKRRL